MCLDGQTKKKKGFMVVGFGLNQPYLIACCVRITKNLKGRSIDIKRQTSLNTTDTFSIDKTSKACTKQLEFCNSPYDIFFFVLLRM
jgi:hypothetical protein